MTEDTSRLPRHPREHFLMMCVFQVLTVLRLFQECFWPETSSCRGFRLQGAGGKAQWEMKSAASSSPAT